MTLIFKFKNTPQSDTFDTGISLERTTLKSFETVKFQIHLSLAKGL